MTQTGRNTLAAFLEPDLEVGLQVRWAARLAVARGLDLLLIEHVESADERIVEVSLDEASGHKLTAADRRVMAVVAESASLRAGARTDVDSTREEALPTSRIVNVRIQHIHASDFGSLRRCVQAELRKSKVKLFTAAGRQLIDLQDREVWTENLLFLRYIPCEVVLCQGYEVERDLSHVLVVASGGPHGRAALRLGLDLAESAGGTLTALHVNPSVGVDVEQVGASRLSRLLRSCLGDRMQQVDQMVVVDNQVHRAVRQVWEGGHYDLVVTGTAGAQIERSVATKLGKGIPVVIATAASPIGSRVRSTLEEGIRRFVPQIERADRVALVDRLQSSAEWNFDFVTLMVLSTVMAAVGLIQNSAAVVIGAMLVAPLMTPLLGLGLALTQGNSTLARISLRSIVLGLGVALLFGVMVGICTPGFVEPTREMLARGAPGLLDLLVAFAAGLAAAYASSRPSLIAALPGVAIAAALVPPIATSGLALSLGDFPLALGAMLLFVINMFTIVLASIASLWMVGLRGFKRVSHPTTAGLTAVAAAVVALGVYLSLSSRASELAEEKLPAGLIEAVQESLGAQYEISGLSVAYDELGVQLNVTVVGETPAPEELATDVRGVASGHYDQPVRVRLLTQIAIDINPDEREKDTK